MPSAKSIAFHSGLRQTPEPLVSVITACYNAGETLAATIDSLRNQSSPHFEYIIADGSSSDNTTKVIQANQDAINYWCSSPDRGMYDAMNRGAEMATGKYLAFLNADDTYLPETIERIIAHPDFGKADVLHGNIIKVREIDGRKYEREELPDASFMPRGMGIFHPAAFVKTTLFRDSGGYDTRFRQAADYALFLKLYQRGAQFVHLNTPIARFSLGGASNSSCTTYAEAAQIQRELKTGTAGHTTLLLWKCRFRRLAVKFIETVTSATGTGSWLKSKRKKRWAQ